MGAQKNQNPSSKSTLLRNPILLNPIPTGFHQIDLLSLLQLVPKRTISPFRFRSRVRTLSNILFEDLHRRFKQLFFFDRNQGIYKEPKATTISTFIPGSEIME